MIFPKGIRTAVEVQISDLKAAEWEKKLTALVYSWTSDYQRRYPWIWFYVSTEELKEAGEAAIEELADEEQKCISFVVENDLFIADAWSEATNKHRKTVKQ